MSDETKKSHATIRTYANDLDTERVKQNKPTKVSSTPPLGDDTAPKKKKKRHQDEAVFISDKESDPIVKIAKEIPKLVVKKPKETPVAAAPVTKIPAFHELNKHEPIIKSAPKKEKVEKAPKIKTSETKPKKIKSKKVNVGFDATVITDTKSKSFRLVPSVLSSIKNWFKSLTAGKKHKKAPKYTVPETSRRKGVIQKATSKTGAIFSEDNDTLKEKIRLRQKRSVRDSDTNWSPYTETGFNLLETPDATQNVAVEFKHSGLPKGQENEVGTQTTEGTEEDKLDILAEARWAASHEEVVKPKPGITSTPPDTREIIETEPAEAEKDVPEEETPELTPSEQEEESKDTEQEPSEHKPKSKSAILGFETNALTITLVVMIVGFLIILFTARITLQQLSSDPQTAPPEEVSASLLQNSELQNILVSSENINRIATLVSSAAESAPVGTVEFPIVSQAGDEVTPSYLFETLNFKTIAAFRQSLTAARFVSFNQSQPLLIIQFVDEDTVKGGFLSWEETMASDLSLVYDLPDTEEVEFTDNSVSGYDVRVLEIEGGVVLMYGILNNNTALIGTDKAVFKQISELSLSN